MTAAGAAPPPATDRDVFERVAAHLLAQGCQAREIPGGICRYRATAEGGGVLRCAVGCLIPDDLYRPSLEGIGVAGDAVSAVLLLAGVLSHEDLDVSARVSGPHGFSSRLRMLFALQELHDQALPETWAERLEARRALFSPEGGWEGAP